MYYSHLEIFQCQQATFKNEPSGFYVTEILIFEFIDFYLQAETSINQIPQFASQFYGAMHGHKQIKWATK